MERPKIGLALGSGAAKGFAHIGVLKALEENNIDVDMISGCSAGALIGGLYCFGLTPYEIERIAIETETRDWIDLTIPKQGLIKGRKIEKMIKKYTDEKNIEQLKKPFLSVATNLNNSEKHIFRTGPLHEAIRASISIPGVFEPVQLDGMSLVDGAVLDRVPITALKELKPDIIIGVNLGFTSLDQENTNIIDVIIQSVELLTEQAMSTKKLEGDVIIEPDLRSIGPTRFDLASESIEIGYKATIEKMDDIKRVIEQFI